MEPQDNWSEISASGFGLSSLLAKIMLEGRVRAPEINGPCLLITSDYSGSHAESSYEIYSVLLADLKFCSAWHTSRLAVRARHLRDSRRISYKGLNDRRQRAALMPFLRAADLIPGMCISLAVSKSVDSLFQRDTSPVNPEVLDCLAWHRSLFERALRIVHLVSFLIAGLSRPNQDVLWFSDEDEIAANPARLSLLAKVWENVMNNYTVHPLRHLKCGTTKCDNGSNDIEDFAAVPDLVAGGLSDLLTAIAGSYRVGIISPVGSASKTKARVVGHWLSQQGSSLEKVVLAIDRDVDSRGLVITRLRFDDLSSAVSVVAT